MAHISYTMSTHGLPDMYTLRQTTRIHSITITYCILRGRIKGFNCSITTTMCEDGSYRTVVG